MIHISKSEKETAKIAEKLAISAQPGDIFALRGNLGSGKTTFAQYFAKGLGIEETVTSPTFVIMKTYPFMKALKESTLVHIDAYRFGRDEEAESIGLPELIDSNGSIILIEWPEKVWSYIKDKARLIDFEYIDEKTRKITLE